MVDVIVSPDAHVIRESEVERAYSTLKSWLMEARLAPGQFLSEAELALECGTSGTPVREALSRLAQDGWLSRIRRKGYLVVPISIREIVELYEYRRLLECFAIGKVAQSVSDDQIEELDGLCTFEQNNIAKVSDILTANIKFHLRLAELSSNKRVLNQLDLVLCYVRRLDTICTQRRPGEVRHNHEEIVSALRAHDAEKAKLEMARHLDLSCEKMLRLFGA